MVTDIDDLHRRIDRIERQNSEEVLALVEILSNATFFGEIKKTNCEYAKDGQCGFFVLDGEDKKKMPIITECRIRGCQEPSLHCHIEISNISCTLCQRIVNGPKTEASKRASKNNSQNNVNSIKKAENKARKQK